jgi:hypothetical protein
MSDEYDPEQRDGSDEHSAVQPTDAEREILGLKPPKHRKEDRIQRERREADEWWRFNLSTIIGRREIWRLIAGGDAAHAFETRFPAGTIGFPDPNAAWYARGEQDFGLRLYQRLLMLDPIAVAAMHQENDPRFADKRKSE